MVSAISWASGPVRILPAIPGASTVASRRSFFELCLTASCHRGSTSSRSSLYLFRFFSAAVTAFSSRKASTSLAFAAFRLSTSILRRVVLMPPCIFPISLPRMSALGLFGRRISPRLRDLRASSRESTGMDTGRSLSALHSMSSFRAFSTHFAAPNLATLSAFCIEAGLGIQGVLSRSQPKALSSDTRLKMACALSISASSSGR